MFVARRVAGCAEMVTAQASTTTNVLRPFS